MRILKRLIYFASLIVVLWSCESAFLDAKPQRSLLIPATLTDLEALLNNSRSIMNRSGYVSIFADGDFRISDSYLPSVNDAIRFNYKWSDETTTWIGDWDYAYQQVFYANVVLQGLDELKGEYDETKADELRGRAMFHRAWSLHLTAEQFAGVYDKQTAAGSLGIPYPVSPDVNQAAGRGSLQETYDQLFSDLHQALELLPSRSEYITQPSKVAAYALLARLHLIAGEYKKSLDASSEALKISDVLLNYNDLNPSLSRSFPIPIVTPNPEILYYAAGALGTISNQNVYADTSLYSLYPASDLRKKLYYTGLMNYKGSYSGGTTPFTGLATDEVYLIKAECEARLGEMESASNTLNRLRAKRYDKRDFEVVSETDEEKLLNLILMERRKELVARGTTWMDLRRLNKEPGRERTLFRMIEGRNHTLKPDGQRYVMKIPMDEIGASGIEQNP
jgi:tetratricopeptide (TPR) repeat protein